MTTPSSSAKLSQKVLMNFIEYNTFQGFYKVTSGDKDQTAERVFNKCILAVIDWVRSRIELNEQYDGAEVRFLYDYPSLQSEEASVFDVFGQEDFHLKRAKKQFDIAIFALKEFGEWTIRIREPNNKEEKDYLDWLFTTDVALKMAGDYVLLACRTKCKESHKRDNRATPFRPKFLTDMFKDEYFVISEAGVSSHDYQMDLERVKIEISGNAKKDDYAFLKVVKDPGRQMPLIFCPALRGEDNRKDRYRVRTLAWHMSGEAYVVTDEQKNGYKDLFKDRMADVLKQAGLTANEALEQIKTNYLYLEPSSDGEKFKWFPMDPAIDELAEPEENEELPAESKKVIKDEIKGVEDHVYERLLSRNDTDTPDIDYGVTMFYSELWSEYINNSDDSKRLEEAIAAREAAEQRLKELTESHEEDVSAKVDEVVKELSEKLEEGHRREMQSERARFEERLNKKEARINELSAARDEDQKTIKDLDEKLRKNYDYSVENAKLAYLNSFLSKSYKRGALTDWVTENMGALIEVHGDADDSYRKWGYPKEDLVRNAFIMLYADELLRAGEMSQEVYDAVHTDKTMSGFELDRSGEDGKKHPIDGNSLDQHVVYSEHSADMFRIYYYRDEAKGKIVVGYIGKHL